MARATRYAGRETHRARLLAVGLWGFAAACASMGPPPGGPFDEDPPVLLAVAPDSGTTVEGFDDDVEFQFDEIVSEQGLDRLFSISPRHEETKVSWKRSRITVTTKCPHVRRRSQCRECGGRAFCAHGGLRRQCRECVECGHGKVRAVCAENGGAEVWQLSDDDLMALAEERNLRTKGKTRQQLINDLR